MAPFPIQHSPFGTRSGGSLTRGYQLYRLAKLVGETSDV
ncbi:hypothetical protein PLANPX_3711 [Lacipirellula parvula]|uniref:Uncharacterized protein n=1 Tax=Lacipirellula parvula TaxID=2650471 RepID=A0A5K7XM73_9BACT|nr:hypothetical protein PLANPX_3711 [Lacipirellula parvula]